MIANLARQQTKRLRHIKRLSTVPAGLCLLGLALLLVGRVDADGLLFRDDGNFTELIAAAQYYEKANGSSQALHYYQLATKKAVTDVERAQAYLGVAKHTRIRYGQPNPATDGVDKLAAYRAVLELPQATPAARIEAAFGKAETEVALGQYEAALASLKPLADIPEVSPAQRRQMQLWNGQILIEARRFDEGRARLNEVIQAPDATLADKNTAHKTITRAYLAQKNLVSALAEIDKINALPGLTDAQRADLHLANGNLLTESEYWKAARDEYGKVAVLVDVPGDKNLMARIKIGESFYQEKDYAKARETWAQVVEMRGGEAYAKYIWRMIGVAYAEEKNYPRAREAYEKWLAVPGIEIKDKVQAWQYIANAYVQEKNYQAARDAISNIDKGFAPTTYDGSSLFLRKEFDLADIYLAEGETNLAVGAYLSMLDHIKNFSGTVLGIKPQDHYEAPRLIKEAADKLAKEPATLAAAYTLYDGIEKFYPYDLQKAEALIGMGDVLVAQGKPAEARTRYEKAYELRKNYDEGNLAQEKLRRLDAQQPSG